MNLFDYKDNELYCEDLPLELIAREVGTPCYVWSEKTFKNQLLSFDAAWDGINHLTCYSVKVASNLSLLEIVAQNGLGADIVSGGELFRALKAGIEPSKIVYSGVGKTASEMVEALEAGILMFNVESKPELELLSKIARERNKVAPVAIRVNPDVDPQTHPYVATGLKESKFGVATIAAIDMYNFAAQIDSLNPIGLDCHIGSQLLSLSPFQEAARRLKELLISLRSRGLAIKYVDLGGGLGINYDKEEPPSPEQYASALKAIFEDVKDLTIITEPGRVVAGNSSILLVSVLYNKKTQVKDFVVIDGAINDLIRPSFYGSFHGIVPVRLTDRPAFPVDVVGPICESGDFLAKDRSLSQVFSGEYLAIKSAGAYGFSMSSNYNSRLRAAEVLVSGDTYRVIRRRETREDLIRGE
ncbi:MAG: diaminopimelate decarboxylase [Deltaproteobacteria bacterium]|jgi:diaminopimelate decarboxylase|nr:diaminopimelate decarboxylase [Deltaproteobacteria bacterium]